MIFMSNRVRTARYEEGTDLKGFAGEVEDGCSRRHLRTALVLIFVVEQRRGWREEC